MPFNLDPPAPQTPEEIEREWYERVYRGDDMPQLTMRALIMGSILGAFMSLSNLYIGLKTGWGLGVAITACVLSFTIWKTMRKLFPGLITSDMSILENNAMQSTASSAGYSTGGTIVSAIAAYLLINGVHLGYGLLTLWVFFLAVLGVTMAIPMKRQMINIEQLKFPSGIAAAETLRSLHGDRTHGGKDNTAKALFWSGGLGVVIATVRDWFAWLPGSFNIFGRTASLYTINMEGSLLLVAAGGIMGWRVCWSLLLGALVCWGVLAPDMINRGVIEHPAPMMMSADKLTFPFAVQEGDSIVFQLVSSTKGLTFAEGTDTSRLVYRFMTSRQFGSLGEIATELNASTLSDGSRINPLHKILLFGDPPQPHQKGKMMVQAQGQVHSEAALILPEADNQSGLVKQLGFTPGAEDQPVVGGYRNIVSWALWGGAACMVTSGLLSFLFQWKTVVRAFSGLKRIFARKKQVVEDPLERIEVPGSWFAGLMLVGTIGIVAVAWIYFAIPIWMSLLAVVLSFFLALVACRACGETDTTPVGAMGKITQLTFGALAPKQMNTNLMTACITAGVADSASDLLTDLKSGYVLGANARKQFLAQFAGIFIGTIVVVPAFYLIVPDPSVLGSDKFPAPAAQVWASVALLLSNGFESLHPTARWALVIGGLVGIIITALERIFPKQAKYIPSAMGLGLAFVIPFYNSLSMFIGGTIALIYEKWDAISAEKYIIPVASGLIAGESLMGIFITLLQALGWI